MPIMLEFKEIDSCIRASAKELRNINEVREGFGGRSRTKTDDRAAILSLSTSSHTSDCTVVRLQRTKSEAGGHGSAAKNILWVFPTGRRFDG